MGGKLRVVHALNQFFAGVGGDERADLAPVLELGARGPGRLLETLDPDLEVVATLVFGDDYAASDPDRAIAELVALLARVRSERGPIDLLIAGPAFGAGRYGMTCGALCRAAHDELAVPAVTAMHPDNPGVDVFRRDVVIARAGADVMSMRETADRVLRVGRHLLAGDVLDPDDGDILPRGLRENRFVEKTGAVRAVDLLLRKLQGEAIETEYPMPVFDRVPPAEPLADATKARIALVTSGGIVPRGNPDRIESASASHFASYSIEGLDALSADSHQTAHGGYDPTYANADPNRVLPVDALRTLEREGRIGSLCDRYYVTVGNGTSVDKAREFGEAIAALLVADGVQAVILTST